MDEFVRLIKHLENLKQSKVQTATFDVNWLLDTVKSRPPAPPMARSSPPIIMDGGGFGSDQ